MPDVKPIPTGYTTVTPCITVTDSVKAIDFYKRAFGATERGRHVGPDGKMMHAEIQIGTSIIMLNDEIMGSRSPQSFGGSPANFYLYFESADSAFKKAVAAGAKELFPVTDMFWGDRMGHVEDPFGYRWNIATHIKDLTPDEIRKAGDEFAKQMAGSR